MSSGPFVDEDFDETDPVVVPCPCVGKPHEQDTVFIKRALSGFDVARVQGAMFSVTDEGKPSADVSASNLAAMEVCVMGWTFVDKDGTAIPFERRLVNKLRSDIWRIVADAVEKKTEAEESPLGTGSSGTGSNGITPLESTTRVQVPRVYSPSLSTRSPASDTSEPSSS